MSTINIENPAETSAPPAKGIQVTKKAIARIRAVLAKENISPDEGGLRLGVQGGGCSGLSYNIRFDTQPRERDRVFQFDDVRVFVDPKSFIYLHGMVLDYEETLMHQVPEPEREEVLRLWHFVLVRSRSARRRTQVEPDPTWARGKRTSSCNCGIHSAGRARAKETSREYGGVELAAGASLGRGIAIREAAPSGKGTIR
jgi:iron-sulfur cluster assembly protein